MANNNGLNVLDAITAAKLGKGAGGSGGVTKEYVDTQVGAVSERVSDVESVIPSAATPQNKLATTADVSGNSITSTSTTSPVSTASGSLRKIAIYGKSEVVDGDIHSAGEGWSTVDLGTLDWGYNSTLASNPFFYASDINIKLATSQSINENLVCAAYNTYSFNTTLYDVNIDKAIGVNSVDNAYKLVVKNTDYTDAETFKSAMSGVLLCYQLADPTQGNCIAVKTDNGSGIDGTMAVFETGTPLRGIPDTDVRDVMAWDGSSGEVTKVCNKANASDLTWSWSEEYQIWRSNSLSNLIKPSEQQVLQSFIVTPLEYTGVSWQSFGSTDKTYSVNPSGTIGFKDTNYDSTKTPDFEFLYELATPSTTPLTQAENDSFAALQTYSPQTTVAINDSPEFEVKAYAGTANGQAVSNIQKDLQGQIDEVKNATKPRVYAFYVDQNDSNPATCVHPYYNTKYGCDNLFYQNAYMDYEKDEFNYGSWEDFIKEFFKPCMLAYDGHVDYYLDPDDYETKLDGGTSDIKDINYNGNVMVQIKTLYFKRWTTDGKYYCIISDKKLDKSFKAFAHHDIKGNVVDYIYRAAYDGSYDGTRLRSISGIDYHNANALTVNKIMSNTTRQQEIDFAKANNDANEQGEGWNILHKAEWDLINDLLLLIGMSTNTQATFGNGNISSYESASNTGIIATGTMDKKGLFYGKNDNVSGVKVFGIEMPWGNIWKSCAGWILSANQYLVKMTPGNEDGSTATGYNLDGTGYVATGKSIAANGYISAFDGADTGFLPTAASGSATTYMCDYVWQNTAVYYALVGGSSGDSVRCGAFYSRLHSSATGAAWYLGAALSYKPLAHGREYSGAPLITTSPLLTLTAAGWDSTTKQQTVTFAHDTSRRNVIDITIGENAAWDAAGVYAVSETAAGITFECSEMPETALTFRVTSMEVS